MREHTRTVKSEPARLEGYRILNPRACLHGLLTLHRQAGNQAVCAALHAQRQVTEGAPPLDLGPLGPAPSVSAKARAFPRFDLAYFPSENGRQHDQVLATHAMAIQWQPAAAWQPQDRARFRTELVTQISRAWGMSHYTVRTADPTRRSRLADLTIHPLAVDRAADAHTRIIATRLGPHQARPRESVTGHTARLNNRTAEGRDLPVSRRVEPDRLEATILAMRVGPFRLNVGVPDAGLLLQVAQVAAQLAPYRDRLQRRIDASDHIPTRSEDGFADGVYELRVTGHASVGEREPRGLSARRAFAVRRPLDALLGLHPPTPGPGGVAMLTSMSALSVGAQDATIASLYRRVDVELIDLRPEVVSTHQSTFAHEAGHFMLGLDDEYSEVHPPAGARRRDVGDPTQQSRLAGQVLDGGASPPVVVRDADTIMSGGMRILPAHYVPIVDALESLTGLDWTIS